MNYGLPRSSLRRNGSRCRDLVEAEAFAGPLVNLRICTKLEKPLQKGRNLNFLICLTERNNQVIDGLLVVRIERKSGTTMLDRLFGVPFFKVDRTEQILGRNKVRIELHRSGSSFHFLLVFRSADRLT